MTEDAGPRYWIGVDGGGTTTRARLVDRHRHLVADGQAGPSGLSLGVGQAWHQIHLAIAQARNAAGITDFADHQCAIGLGLAGVHDSFLKEQFLQRAPRYASIAVETDSFIALLGAHGDNPGIVLVAGTGSVAEALWADGSRRSVGGWGFGVGDEGSGAWLGLQAMRHVHHVLDGQLHEGPLARAVKAATHDTENGLRAWCHRANQTTYASLAPLVFELAPHDAFAEAILQAAVRALEGLVLALDPRCELPIALSGSVAHQLRPRLVASLGKRLITPIGQACDGAIVLARRHAKADALKEHHD